MATPDQGFTNMMRQNPEPCTNAATTPPLTFRVITDETKPRAVRDNGQVEFTIGSVELHAGSVMLSRDIDKSLAMYMMF